MKFKREYKITKWEDWSNKLTESIDDFYNYFSVYPKILEANEHTLSQFDFITNVKSDERKKVKKENMLTKEIEKLKPNDKIVIDSFSKGGKTVRFAVDENMEDKVFRLVFDSDADWGDDDTYIDTPVGEYDFVTTN